MVGEYDYFSVPWCISFSLKDKMYQDTFEEDDLIAEVELVTQARYSENNEVDDKYDTEGVHFSLF